MQRKTLHFALDFFLVGAAIPVLLLVCWRLLFEHAEVAAQHRFIQAAFLLWPTSMQILVVPHGEGGFGHAVTIAILLVQNGILYSLVALVVHWLVAWVRNPRISQSH